MVVNSLFSTKENDGERSSESTAAAAAAATTTTVKTGATATTRGRKRSIAILSGYVHKDEAQSRLPDHYMVLLLNKACYAYRHNYDLIFNTTWGFPNEYPRNISDKKSSRVHHLGSGSWHVVPYMEAILPKYDWILWIDADYIFQQMDESIDRIIDEWETSGIGGGGRKNIHVLVPPGIADGSKDGFAFQSWAVLIRNSPFGHSVIHYWKEFALGLCQRGNFRQKKYTWRISDQPGLWYALIKTHIEHFGNTTTNTSKSGGEGIDFNSSLLLQLGCDPQTGYLKVDTDSTPLMREMNDYFGLVFQNHSHSMANLSDFPKDQPILWSTSENINESTSNSNYKVMGLGIDLEPFVGFWRYKTGITPIPVFPSAFGLHVKRALSPNVLNWIKYVDRN